MDHCKASGKKPMIPIRDEMKLSFFSICPNGSRENCHKCGKSFTPTHRIFLTKLISGKTSINCVPFLQISVINCDTIHKRMWHHFSKPSASWAQQNQHCSFDPPGFETWPTARAWIWSKQVQPNWTKDKRVNFHFSPHCVLSLCCTCCSLLLKQFLIGQFFSH